jgi:hypothetical protein
MTRRLKWAAALIACAMAPAAAQLPGIGGSPLGGLPGGMVGPGGGAIGGGSLAPLAGVGGTIDALSPSSLLALRAQRLDALVRANRRDLDVDDKGNPIRRDEIIGIGLSPDSLARAGAAGFRVSRQESIAGIALDLTILTPPPGKPARKAIRQLQAADPAGAYTLDHVYEPSGGALTPRGPALAPGDDDIPAGPIGLVDGGVGNHPAFAGARLEQRGFAGAVRPSGHGTAVASLLIGHVDRFSGAAPGRALLVADVYGGSPANGSAEAIARAMGWLAERRARVVNVSLIGPPNPLLDAAVRALQRRGILVVAAVGNDGPAAPPQYPASCPGVIAVTAVDARDKVLIEAGRASHLDFAAPGADMVAAVPGGGWERVRGTSFAAPLVAGSLAMAAAGDARNPVDDIAARARPGRGVGRGIVCASCRTPPAAVGLK